MKKLGRLFSPYRVKIFCKYFILWAGFGYIGEIVIYPDYRGAIISLGIIAFIGVCVFKGDDEIFETWSVALRRWWDSWF